MAAPPSHVGNPLTLLAVFASISEAVSAAALPFLNEAPDDRIVLIWFVVLFPSALVLLFFGTLWVAPARLYGPGDYKSDEAFLSTIKKRTDVYSADDDSAKKLRDFWKPGGVVDPANGKALLDWMIANGVGTSSIALFLRSADYRTQRDKAVADLNL